MYTCAITHDRTTAHPKLSVTIQYANDKAGSSRYTSPVLRHIIAPFEFAIVVVVLYHASYGDTPPAQMIWKKQIVGGINKKGIHAPDTS